MIRAALVAAALVAVATAAAWFADNPGGIAIDWRGWRIETSVGTAVLLGLLVLAAFTVVHRLWLWLRHLPRRRGLSREAERRRQGYRALTRGLVAVAAGDAEESARLAKRAEALLSEPPLTLLLSAQAAQLTGDERAAERYFEAMLANPEMEFLGLRGLLRGALRGGANTKALALARRAYRLRPTSEWVQGTLLELQLGAAEWKQAEALLTDLSKRRAAPDDLVRRRRAILLLEQAAAVDATGDRAAAAALAARAHDSAPGFVPAAVAAARLYGATGKQRRAQRALEDAWRLSPHPDLAAAVAAAWPGESPVHYLRHTEALVAAKSGTREGGIVLARACVAVADWPAARNYLEAVMGSRPEARVCQLRAAIEDGEFGPGLAAREWLMRAAAAPADPAWACSNCGQPNHAWAPNCPHCLAFDALAWRAAESVEPPPEPTAPEPEPEPPAVLAPPAPPAAAPAPPPPAPARHSNLEPTQLKTMPLPPDVPTLDMDDQAYR